MLPGLPTRFPNVELVDADLSSRRRHQPYQTLQECGLAAAVGTQQGESLASIHSERNIVHCYVVAILFCQVAYLDHSGSSPAANDPTLVALADAGAVECGTPHRLARVREGFQMRKTSSGKLQRCSPPHPQPLSP